MHKQFRFFSSFMTIILITKKISTLQKNQKTNQTNSKTELISKTKTYQLNIYYEIFFRFVNFDLPIFFSTLTLKNNYEKKYYEIIKSEIYQKKFILKFKKFIEKCNNVFWIWFIIYEKYKTKITFVVFLFNQILELN